MRQEDILNQAKRKLIETGGRTSQDLGAGRIVGQVLVFLYLQESECSLDDIRGELGLSKASVSIAARQLEQMGLAKKVWVIGDRKRYFKSAENIASALQDGILTLVKKKVRLFGEELDNAAQILSEFPQADDTEKIQEAVFLKHRIERAGKLQRKLGRVLNNPLVKLLSEIR